MAWKKSFKSRSKKTFSKKSFKGKSNVAKRNSAFKRRVKSIILKTAEPKRLTSLHGKFEFLHNVPSYTANLMSSTFMPSQGVADTQRIGDQINVSGLHIKMLCGQKADRENVTFKIWVCQVAKGSAYTYATWFEAITNNCLLDDLNKDFVKVVASRTVKYNVALDVGEEFTFPYKLWIPYKKLVKFGPASAATTNSFPYDLVLLMAVYDAYGTLSSDNIAYAQISSTLHYKDP